MSAKILTKFALTTTTGLLVGGPVAGVAYFLLSSTTSGYGKAVNPRLIMAKASGTNSELSFSYDSFFRGGQEVGKPVAFKDTKISFNGYQLKVGDILCSPSQNGKFFILEEIVGRGSPLPSTYRIKGYSDSFTTTRCNWYDFPAEIRDTRDESKTIELKGFGGTRWRNGWYSAGIDTIFVSSCFFELTKNQSQSNFKFDISWDKCKLKEYGNYAWNIIQKTQLSAEYEVK